MNIDYRDRTQTRGKTALGFRVALVCVTAMLIAIAAPPMGSTTPGQVYAESTELEGASPRELSAGWEQFGRALVIYSLVLLVISVMIVLAHRVHGNIFASEEEQRTRDEWYGGSNDDRSGWSG